MPEIIWENDLFPNNNNKVKLGVNVIVIVIQFFHYENIFQMIRRNGKQRKNIGVPL